jgi:hypothetical protein
MITSQEQIDLFYNKYNIDLLDLFIEIKNKCQHYGLPILNNEKNNSQNEFIDLILENTDLKKLFIKHYKMKQ